MGRLSDLFALTGLVLLVAGAWLVLPALGVLIAGLECLAVARALLPRGGSQ